MKLLALSDYRSQPLEWISELIRKIKPDAVLYAGDDLDRVLPIIEKSKTPFYYVNGNDDNLKMEKGKCLLIYYESIERKITKNDEDYEYYKEIGLDTKTDWNEKSKKINPSFNKITVKNKNKQISIFGIECSAGMKSKIKNKPTKYADIYLSHIPPKGCLDLSRRFGVAHIGSKELLDAVKRYKPKLVVCGHSHMWGGKIKKIGNTIILNISNHDTNKSILNYAIINTDDWSIKLAQRQFIKTNTSTPTIENLWRIPGASTLQRKLREKSNESGYDIIDGYDPKIERLLNDDIWENKKSLTTKEIKSYLKKLNKQGIDTTTFEERLASISLDKPRIKRKINFNINRCAFLDVETGPFKKDELFGDTYGDVWLIGLKYNEEIKQFLYPQQKKEFNKYIKKNSIKYFTTWTGYDRRSLRKTGIDITYYDACMRTRQCVIWHTYKLDELYRSFFPEHHDEAPISGAEAGMYAEHMIIHNRQCSYCPPKDEIKQKIMEKNKQDILKMEKIVMHLLNGPEVV